MATKGLRRGSSAARTIVDEPIRPTPELVAKFGQEPVNLGDMQPGARGRTVRVASDWTPDKMLKRGSMTKRQHQAATRLASLFDAGFVPKSLGQDLSRCVRVDASRRTPVGPSGMLDAAQSYRDAEGRLPPAFWAVVEAVVVRGKNLKEAASMPLGRYPWLPANEVQREGAIKVLLCGGLEFLANEWRF